MDKIAQNLGQLLIANYHRTIEISKDSFVASSGGSRDFLIGWMRREQSRNGMFSLLHESNTNILHRFISFIHKDTTLQKDKSCFVQKRLEAPLHNFRHLYIKLWIKISHHRSQWPRGRVHPTALLRLPTWESQACTGQDSCRLQDLGWSSVPALPCLWADLTRATRAKRPAQSQTNHPQETKIQHR